MLGKDLRCLCGAWGVGSCWINGVSAWLMVLLQLPPQHAHSVCCRCSRLGPSGARQGSGSRHSCSAAAFSSYSSSSRRLDCADGPRETWSFLELLSSGSAPIKLSFYGCPCACGCVCATTSIYNTFKHHLGPAFSNAVSRSLDPLGLWFILKLVYFGFENTALLFGTN